MLNYMRIISSMIIIRDIVKNVSVMSHKWDQNPIIRLNDVIRNEIL